MVSSGDPQTSSGSKLQALMSLDRELMGKFRPTRNPHGPEVDKSGIPASNVPAKVTSVCFDDRGENCIMTNSNDAFALYDVSKGTKKNSYYSKKYGISHARFTHRSPNIIHASTKADDHAVRYLSTHDNKYLQYFRGHTGRVRSLHMNPVDDSFLSAGDDGQVRLWDLRTEHCKGLINDVGGSVVAAFDNTGEVLATACSENQSIMLYAVNTIDAGSFLQGPLDDPLLSRISQPPPKPLLTSVSFSNNGLYLLVGTSLRIYYVYDAFDLIILRRLVLDSDIDQESLGSGRQDRADLGEEVCWTSDSQWVIAGSPAGKLHMWDLSPRPGETRLNKLSDLNAATMLPTVSLPGGSRAPTRAVRFHPRLCAIAVGSEDFTFWLPSRDDQLKLEEQGY